MGDWFGVFVDPQNVIVFLDRANINLDDGSVFYFLLSFPFYEHEWDIAGFLFNALFGDEDGDNIKRTMRMRRKMKTRMRTMMMTTAPKQ